MDPSHYWKLIFQPSIFQVLFVSFREGIIFSTPEDMIDSELAKLASTWRELCRAGPKLTEGFKRWQGWVLLLFWEENTSSKGWIIWSPSYGDCWKTTPFRHKIFHWLSRNQLRHGWHRKLLCLRFTVYDSQRHLAKNGHCLCPCCILCYLLPHWWDDCESCVASHRIPTCFMNFLWRQKMAQKAWSQHLQSWPVI